MENKLNCEIVRDLLPSYTDRLTSDITNKAIEKHIASCESCSEALKLMKAPEPQSEAPAAEVDYLKRLRRHTRRRSTVIGIVLMLIGVSLLLFRYFYIGNEIDASEVLCNVSVAGDILTLNGTLASSGLGVSRVTFSESNGMVRFKIYASLVTPFTSGSFTKTYKAYTDIVQVRSGDLIIWEDGTAISTRTAQLFAATNPYIGDMPSNSRIAQLIGVYDQFGSYTSELQTGSEPYGWIIILDTPINGENIATAQSIMEDDSCAMLACINNLGYVTWRYNTADGAQEFTLTARQASELAGRDIKLFADSASDFQKLIQSLGYKWSGVKSSFFENSVFYLRIKNDCSSDIYSITIDYYIDGELVGSRTAENADKTALRVGDSFSFEFIPEDFPNDSTLLDLSGFSFNISVSDANGKQTLVREGVDVSAAYSWSYYFVLSGSKANGFALIED